MRSTFLNAAAMGAALAMAGAAHAQDSYISVSGGVTFLGDSNNDGEFTSDFLTGAGTMIPAGTPLPAGTPVGWETDFDTGFTISGAFGRYYGDFRGEIEVAYQNNQIGSHAGVEAAGIALDGEDAGVLITGSPNLGVNVGELVADGQGSVETIFVMANVLYDFDMGGPITPYVGAGVGVGFVNVDYAPSATPIISDNATSFAYQAMAGVAYRVSSNTELFAGYRYRATLDPEVQASLIPAEFDVENRASVVEAGLRFSF